MAFRTPTGQTQHTHAPPVTGVGSSNPPPQAAFYQDDDAALARLRHDVAQGRPLDHLSTLPYEHLASREDPDPWGPDYPQHPTAYAS